MSKLDELIAELCPDGVEYMPVGELCSIQTGSQINKENFKNVGEYPVYNGGINPSGYHDDFNTEANTIAISQGGASAGFVNWVDVPFFAGAHCYTIKNVSKLILNRYLYFYLKNKQDDIQNSKHGAGIPGLNSRAIKNLRIPVPPLPVQQEIVRILDNFTELTTQLTAEIEARKKQYEYYRDWLLSQEELNKLCPDGVEYSKLDSICNLITTGKLNANAMVENGKYPFFTCDANPYRINEYAFDTTAIIISGNGSQVGHINFYQGKFNAYQRTYVLSEFNNVDVKYLLHYLKGNLNNYIILHSKKGSVPYITMPMLKNFSVPVPPMPVQQEIVRILDSFTESAAELRVELETELEARQKQYEYYRDKLLTFPARSKDVKESKEATA